MRSAKTTLILLVFASLLTACGLKGPLYLPEDEQTTEAAADLTEETKKERAAKEENEGNI